jgi:hypothetical protein
MEDKSMNSEYTITEVIEIGEAQEVILGQKVGDPIDSDQPFLVTSLDLDE